MYILINISIYTFLKKKGFIIKFKTVKFTRRSHTLYYLIPVPRTAFSLLSKPVKQVLKESSNHGLYNQTFIHLLFLHYLRPLHLHLFYFLLRPKTPAVASSIPRRSLHELHRNSSDDRPLVRLAQRPELQHNPEPIGRPPLRPRMEQWNVVFLLFGTGKEGVQKRATGGGHSATELARRSGVSGTATRGWVCL